MDIRPDFANVERNGKLEKVDPDDVKIGEIIVIKPGEKVPLDGYVIEGKSSLDTKALTGEAIHTNTITNNGTKITISLFLLTYHSIKVTTINIHV